MKHSVTPVKLASIHVGVREADGQKSFIITTRHEGSGNGIAIALSMEDARRLHEGLTQIVGNNQPPIGRHAYTVAMNPGAN